MQEPTDMKTLNAFAAGTNYYLVTHPTVTVNPFTHF